MHEPRQDSDAAPAPKPGADEALAKDKILLVDDDPLVLESLRRTIRRNFNVETAPSGPDALEMMKTNGPYAVLVVDMDMPAMDGLEFLGHAMRLAPDTVRIMLTASSRQQTAIDAVNEGQVFRFLTKPCPPEEINLVLKNAVQKHRLAIAERELLDNTLNGSVRLLTEVIALMDPAGFGRNQAMSEAARKIGSSVGVRFPWQMELAALLCNIGSISIPQSVLEKVRASAELNSDEREMLSQTPRIGSQLLANIPRLQDVARIVLYQQKNFDGTGFPSDAVRGDQIPLESRILKVLLDLAEAESRGVPTRDAAYRMRQRTGTYDPTVVDAVLRLADSRPRPAGSEEKTRQVGFAELAPGQVIKADIRTKDGMLVALAGTTVSGSLVERLRHYGILRSIDGAITIASR